MQETIKLVCEPCPICKRVVPIAMSKKDYKPSITGVTTVIDIHGLTKEPRHCRILYVDERMSVRSFSVVTAVADE